MWERLSLGVNWAEMGRWAMERRTKNELRAQSLPLPPGRTLNSLHHRIVYQQWLPVTLWAQCWDRENDMGEPAGAHHSPGKKAHRAGCLKQPGAAPWLNKRGFLIPFRTTAPAAGHPAWLPALCPLLYLIAGAVTNGLPLVEASGLCTEN